MDEGRRNRPLSDRADTRDKQVHQWLVVNFAVVRSVSVTDESDSRGAGSDHTWFLSRVAEASVVE